MDHEGSLRIPGMRGGGPRCLWSIGHGQGDGRGRERIYASKSGNDCHPERSVSPEAAESKDLRPGAAGPKGVAVSPLTTNHKRHRLWSIGHGQGDGRGRERIDASTHVRINSKNGARKHRDWEVGRDGILLEKTMDDRLWTMKALFESQGCGEEGPVVSAPSSMVTGVGEAGNACTHLRIYTFTHSRIPDLNVSHSHLSAQ